MCERELNVLLEAVELIPELEEFTDALEENEETEETERLSGDEKGEKGERDVEGEVKGEGETEREEEEFPIGEVKKGVFGSEFDDVVFLEKEDEEESEITEIT
jgi:hypothetical protein